LVGTGRFELPTPRTPSEVGVLKTGHFCMFSTT
jgi:hypothetical protein